MEYDVMQEIEETAIFQKIRKQVKEKELDTWKKSTRKPWRKIQREKQKIKYSDLL